MSFLPCDGCRHFTMKLHRGRQTRWCARSHEMRDGKRVAGRMADAERDDIPEPQRTAPKCGRDRIYWEVGQ